MDSATTVRRDIQIETSAAADRFIIDVEQLRGRFDAAIFLCMVKPAGTNRNVALGRNPIRPGPFTGGKTFAAAAWITAFSIQSGPARVPGNSVFVAHPAKIRAGVAEHDRHGHKLTNDSPGVIP